MIKYPLPTFISVIFITLHGMQPTRQTCDLYSAQKDSATLIIEYAHIIKNINILHIALQTMDLTQAQRDQINDRIAQLQTILTRKQTNCALRK